MTVMAVLTDNSREFCGTDTQPFELYLQLNDVEHRTTPVRRPQTNAVIERFNRTMLDEVFRIAFRTTMCESVESLQIDLDAWLQYYNYKCTHQGYRNCSKRPVDSVNNYLQSVGQET